MFCATFKAFSCRKPCSVLKEQLRAKGPHCNCEDVLTSVGNVAIKAGTIPVFPSLDIIEGWNALHHFWSGKNSLETVKFRAQNLSVCLKKGRKYLGKNAEQETVTPVCRGIQNCPPFAWTPASAVPPSVFCLFSPSKSACYTSFSTIDIFFSSWGKCYLWEAALLCHLLACSCPCCGFVPKWGHSWGDLGLK